jgi:ketosteroid isomerase-like protein
MRTIYLLPAVVLAWTVTAAAAEDVSALLKKQTQAFSDAGQAGDGPAMAKMLDDDVVFFNEAGDQATKKDMATPGSPQPKGVTVKMTVQDWHCIVHGTVAVASFIDDQQMDFNGQPFHAQYRSVETWVKQGRDWRMVGSETIALPIDPPAVTLPPKTLDDYVGAYAASPDTKVVFTRKGGDLVASLNSGPETVQKAELRDVFFTPGRARFRKIFLRDANGHVTGFVNRREGHDILFKRVSVT